MMRRLLADLDRFEALMKDYDAQETAEIWNIPISDEVTSPGMRRLKAKGHGVMWVVGARRDLARSLSPKGRGLG